MLKKKVVVHYLGVEQPTGDTSESVIVYLNKLIKSWPSSRGFTRQDLKKALKNEGTSEESQNHPAAALTSLP
ncbi:MAG: hypothetical protein TH68_07055 [Candidatus Synechococcus spongiarum 142]|uniref:Uncharacterized protein n=1 Tax=Candidatus Synechococcus spongiarum 142 TaxID=1608213 RepID=A0A6N3XBT2_9SYNE|nr:MAG: hypothetical protein TH68_07055 [Candidatus Synechococcus spongiarum 142]